MLLGVLPAVVIVGSVLTACSGEESAPTADPSSSSDPAGDQVAAAADLCSKVINERDFATYEAGANASFELLAAVLGAGRVTDAELADMGMAMTAHRDALVADRAELGDGSDLPGWAQVLEPLDATIAVLDRRIEATDRDTWPVDPETLRADGTGVLDEQVLADLGLTRGDCSVVATEPGPVPAERELIASAAVACGTVVDRRAADDYAADSRVVLDAVLAAHQDQDPTAVDGLAAALEAVRDEWQRTHDDLAAVPTDGVAAPAIADAWAANVQYAADRVTVAQERIDALASGDGAALEAAFAPGGGTGAPGFNWEDAALDGRDCRFIDA
ncbi:hypothetical protein ACFQ0K_14480 [Nocardioides caeni]|uniref:Uncharacterized protein n=1 Tax=Nocardioides caeni TaxID=574700 RepID=A0A4V4HKI8_9ACTN|nr:hypothetical protein [Nocardioides caeni]THV14586.1 hypothetical protein E9934_07905 [Nocardioides caeni]